MRMGIDACYMGGVTIRMGLVLCIQVKDHCVEVILVYLGSYVCLKGLQSVQMVQSAKGRLGKPG